MRQTFRFRVSTWVTASLDPDEFKGLSLAQIAREIRRNVPDGDKLDSDEVVDAAVQIEEANRD